MKFGIAGVTAAIVFCLFGTVAQASQIIASNFGPSESYNGDLATPVQHFPNGFYLDQAVRFQPAADVVLDATRLPLFRQVDWPLSLTLNIAGDAGGVPGAPIASQFYDGPLPVDTPFMTETAPPTEFSWSSHNILLQAGTPYWLYLTATPGNLYDIVWSINSTGAQGNYAARGTGMINGDTVWHPSNFFTTPAFSVLSPPVPEPAAVGLALLGTAIVAGGRRRKMRTTVRRR